MSWQYAFVTTLNFAIGSVDRTLFPEYLSVLYGYKKKEDPRSIPMLLRSLEIAFWSRLPEYQPSAP
jgi:hypothetical protein